MGAQEFVDAGTIRLDIGARVGGKAFPGGSSSAPEADGPQEPILRNGGRAENFREPANPIRL